ncbi:hypothetical protein [Chitinimonas sp. BJB300]|uniref:hypothetical protein n=1 Tax=Chitinimonas sp. BJB300 TaxID=1559339 RepID=UPI000C1225F1|nr:hypothetical protein [Chitinimonas sp. BJB300]PHV13516.1 hypothetical protein CSQ89_00335 [Chitinimonas sp. BJB300]TSJ89800.1 hypothetical protein FG002_006200 [Chitinimonas sp. BJB300]
MKVVVRLLLALLTLPLLTACPGMSTADKSEFEDLQAQIPELRPYTVDTKSMAEVYKKIKDKEEGKVKPRLISTVLTVLPASEPEAAELIKENNLPNVPGSSVAIVYTPYGWSVMLVKPGLEVKENQVVEFTLPAATDFDDLDNQEKMKTKLTELQRDGSIGIQSVRSDCTGDTSGNGPFSMSCNGSPANFVTNADQFSQTTLDWLNNPNKPVTASTDNNTTG